MNYTHNQQNPNSDMDNILPHFTKLSISNSKKKKRRIRVPKSLKDRLWDDTFGCHAGSGPCYVCQKTIYARRFEAGHIVPVSKGGPTTLQNLRCICSDCNKSMGNMNLEEFKRKYFDTDHVQIPPERQAYNPSEEMEVNQLFTIEGHHVTSHIKHQSPFFGGALQACYFCQNETQDEFEKHSFNCCQIHVHDKCLQSYLQNIIEMRGRRFLFLAGTTCPSCLHTKL